MTNDVRRSDSLDVGKNREKYSTICHLVVVLVLVCILTPERLSAAETNWRDYPEPRYPKFLVNPSEEEFMKAARAAVRVVGGRAPLGKIERGETVHVYVPHTQDMDVWRAIQAAWAERGVTAIAIKSWEVSGLSEEEYGARVAKNIIRGSDAWREIGDYSVYRPYFSEEIRESLNSILSSEQIGWLRGYLDKHTEIKRVFSNPGGDIAFWIDSMGQEYADRFVGNWTYESKSDLLSKKSEFPTDVWKLVEDQIIEPIRHVSAGTFVDPQGTNLAWYVTPEQALFWAKMAGVSPGHLFMYPMATAARWDKGVVVGASNHTGYHSEMKVHINEYGAVTKIEGGGKNGDMFRILFEHPELKSADFPSTPAKGYWFLSQDGLGTNPKVTRDMYTLVNGRAGNANVSERDRAGVQHLSFTSPLSMMPHWAFGDQAEDAAYAQEDDLPWGHTAHLHNYFGTYKWKLRDTGEQIILVEKGRINAFDHPEVRALASKYGDPEVILSTDWIPQIPGINAPGDYETEYANDPWAWLLKEWRSMQSGTYEYFIEDYEMFSSNAE